MKKFSAVILFILLCLIIKGDAVNPEVSLCFTGDILLDRGVRLELNNEGYDYPYNNVKHILKGADICFGNLECPITSINAPAFKWQDLVFKGDRENVRALKDAGYDILNLANNHSMDQGQRGLKDTLSYLNEAGILALGAGVSKSAARSPVIIEKHGIKIGFLGYTTFPPEGYIDNSQDYTVSSVDDRLLENNIKSARELCDLLVVSFHFGKEFSFYPSDIQKTYGRRAVDYGADIVIGHHPHVLQGMERYKQGFIFYSMGNFVFDRQPAMGTDETCILSIKVNRHGIENMDIIPIKIKACRPTLAVGSDRTYILDKFALYSKGIN